MYVFVSVDSQHFDHFNNIIASNIQGKTYTKQLIHFGLLCHDQPCLRLRIGYESRLLYLEKFCQVLRHMCAYHLRLTTIRNLYLIQKF